MQKKKFNHPLLIQSSYLEDAGLREHSTLGPAAFLFDLHNRCFYALNYAAEALGGFPKGIAINLSELKDKVHPSDLIILLENILPHAEKFQKSTSDSLTSATFSFNLRLRNDDDRFITLLLKSVLLENITGTEYLALSNIFNISGHRKSNVMTYTVEIEDSEISTEKMLNLIHKESFYPRERIAGLTDRESEILQYICEGYSSKQIAGKLDLSIYTINNHRKSILRKTGQNTISGIVKYALKNGYNNRG